MTTGRDPQAPERSARGPPPDATARRRPPAVWIAIGALCVVIAIQVALALMFARSGEVGWGMYAFAGLLWALLVGGLVRGARLAWLWGRYLTLILGALMVFTLLLAAMRHQLHGSVIAVTLLGLALPLFGAGVALGRSSAYAFFDLVCPRCATRTGTSADFLFREARCRKCQNVW